MTSQADRTETGLLTFAQKLLTILDQGLTTATYKYAVLLGLMDLCLEKTGRHGSAPAMVTTTELAEAVLGLYWPHAIAFRGRESVLRQNTNGQAEILSRVIRYRSRRGIVDTFSFRQARLADPGGYADLVAWVEFKLAEMPLPRLQRVGDQVDEFLYRVSFQNSDRAVRTVGAVRGGDFDNRILFVDQASEHLVALSPLLRPLIQREWAAMVAKINKFPESELEGFLFGRPRVATAPLRNGLRDLQNNQCFYCGRMIAKPEIDHFVPWARYADDGLDNLVLTDSGCNNSKRAHLAATEHVERWRERFVADSTLNRDLTDLAAAAKWERDGTRTLGVARGVYLHLPAESRLWKLTEHFELIDPARIARALDVAPAAT